MTRVRTKIFDNLYWRWTDTGKRVIFTMDKEGYEDEYLLFYNSDPDEKDESKIMPSRSFLSKFKKIGN